MPKYKYNYLILGVMLGVFATLAIQKSGLLAPKGVAPVEALAQQVRDCGTLGRMVRSMAAESIEDDYISDLQAGK